MNRLILPILVLGALISGLVGLQMVMGSGNPKSHAAFAATGDGQGVPNPVVLELFTSQGCSSCPPADRLANRMAKDESLLVISRPVTYWDRLGWKDTLAREENTNLQRIYSSKGYAGAGVYTPQIVVNGMAGAVGSREGDIRNLIRTSRNNAGPEIAVTRDASGGAIISISGSSEKLAGVSLLALNASESVSVGRGENGGRRLHYTNVVVDETFLKSWRGGAMQITIPAENLNVGGADKYAIIVQRPDAGPIVGAKLLDI